MVQRPGAGGHGDEEQTAPRYQLAILVDPTTAAPATMPWRWAFHQGGRCPGSRPDPASSAIERLPEFDTLWLRAETAVGHYTFEFARRAEQLKMPVIDSSRAILACNSKLYLYELMVRSGVPCPHHRRDPPRPPACGRTGAAPRSATDGEDPDGAQGRDLAMASDDIQLARLLDEGWPAPALLLVRAGSPPSSTGASAFSTAPVCSPAAADPNPATASVAANPSTPSRIEALPSATCRAGAANRPPRRSPARQQPVRGGSAPAGSGLRVAGNHRQPLDTWRY